MRERVSRLAGSLDPESAPGAGTTLAVSIPLIPAGGQP
jgi:signal transduction histidine kinase